MTIPRLAPLQRGPSYLAQPGRGRERLSSRSSSSLVLEGEPGLPSRGYVALPQQSWAYPPASPQCQADQRETLGKLKIPSCSPRLGDGFAQTVPRLRANCPTKETKALLVE